MTHSKVFQARHAVSAKFVTMVFLSTRNRGAKLGECQVLMGRPMEEVFAEVSIAGLAEAANPGDERLRPSCPCCGSSNLVWATLQSLARTQLHSQSMIEVSEAVSQRARRT